MGRLLKNPDVFNGASAMQLPVVSSASQGDATSNGLMRFNDATKRIEFYYNNAWSSIAKVGTVQIVADTFAGDGSTVGFYMSQAESDATAIAVFIGGVYQQPGTHYTVNGTTLITFSPAPPGPSTNPNIPNTIVVVHNINSTNVAA